MPTFQFKTNINCANCVRTVSGLLNDLPQLQQWSVDTTHPNKILTAEGTDLQPQLVMEAVADAGFDIEPIG